MAQILDRMLRAAKLDVSLYEEVEKDEKSTIQAMQVVLISSVAAGLGSMAVGGLKALIFATVFAVLGWYAWAYLTYFIGTKILPEPQTNSNPGELLRTIGFSSAPGAIRILGIIPILGPIVSLAAGIWMLVAMVVAVKQALDYKSMGRAVGVCAIGWVIQVVVFSLLLAAVMGPQMQAGAF